MAAGGKRRQLVSLQHAAVSSARPLATPSTEYVAMAYDLPNTWSCSCFRHPEMVLQVCNQNLRPLGTEQQGRCQQGDCMFSASCV